MRLILIATYIEALQAPLDPEATPLSAPSVKQQLYRFSFITALFDLEDVTNFFQVTIVDDLEAYPARTNVAGEAGEFFRL